MMSDAAKNFYILAISFSKRST